MNRNAIIFLVIVLLVIAGLIWFFQRDDADISDKTELTVSAYNQTKNIDASSVSADPRDVIVYTLTVANTSDEVISGYVVETNIEDISELATLIDAQGANYNDNNKSLMWTPLDIPANGSIEKQFSVKVKDTLPAESDLVMSTTFNNEVLVAVNRQQVAGNNNTPTPAPTPTPSYTAPTTGPSVWFAAMLAITFTVGIILYRAAKRINV